MLSGLSGSLTIRCSLTAYKTTGNAAHANRACLLSLMMIKAILVNKRNMRCRNHIFGVQGNRA